MVYPRSAILRRRPGSSKMIKSGPILHNRLETVRLRPAHLLGVATALLGFVISAAADNMVTIAGNGSDGFAGDGGNALAAQMGAIWGHPGIDASGAGARKIRADHGRAHAMRDDRDAGDAAPSQE